MVVIKYCIVYGSISKNVQNRQIPTQKLEYDCLPLEKRKPNL